MRNNGILEKFISTYFNETLEISVQSFNLLSISGIVICVIVAFLSAVKNENISVIATNLGIAAFVSIMLHIARKTNYYLLCSRITVIVVFIVTFPVLFFFSGGCKGGLPFFFVLAIFFTATILEKFDRVILLGCEIILYITCFFAYLYIPHSLSHIHSEKDFIFDMTAAFLMSAVTLLLVILLRSRMYNVRQAQNMELTRELTAQNDTLARYDRMKSDFLSTVAHEINTPLAIIAASSHDTLDILKTRPINMEEIEENQIIIEKRVKLINNILLDLLDTVAIENGRLALSRESLNLDELLRNICDAQFKRLGTNGNTLTYDLSPDMPKIWADSNRIEQVMTNLLSNAVRHTKDGNITISLMRDNSRQVVGVTDNGEGMDAEMARIVLKQYVSVKADYWRHGIGLYICRCIVIAHGGDIWIKSEKGRGTSVFFSLLEEEGHE